MAIPHERVCGSWRRGRTHHSRVRPSSDPQGAVVVVMVGTLLPGLGALPLPLLLPPPPPLPGTPPLELLSVLLSPAPQPKLSEGFQGNPIGAIDSISVSSFPPFSPPPLSLPLSPSVCHPPIIPPARNDPLVSPAMLQHDSCYCYLLDNDHFIVHVHERYNYAWQNVEYS